MDFRAPNAPPSTLSTSTKKGPLFVQDAGSGHVRAIAGAAKQYPSRGPFEKPASRSTPVPPPAPPAPFAVDTAPRRTPSMDARSSAILAAHEAKKKLLGGNQYVTSARLEAKLHSPKAKQSQQSQSTSVASTARPASSRPAGAHGGAHQGLSLQQLKEQQKKKVLAAGDFDLDDIGGGGGSRAGGASVRPSARVDENTHFITALRQQNVPLVIESNSSVDRPHITWKLQDGQHPCSNAADKTAVEKGLGLCCEALSDANLRMVTAATCAALTVLPYVDGATMAALFPALERPLGAALGSAQERSAAGAAAVLHAIVSITSPAGERPAVPIVLDYIFQLGAGIERHLYQQTEAGIHILKALILLETYGGADALHKLQEVIPTYTSQLQSAAAPSHDGEMAAAAAGGEAGGADDSILLSDSGVVDEI